MVRFPFWQASSSSNKTATKAKRTGAGGAWRLFVKQNTTGHQGLSDMKGLSHKYKAMQGVQTT